MVVGLIYSVLLKKERSLWKKVLCNVALQRTRLFRNPLGTTYGAPRPPWVSLNCPTHPYNGLRIDSAHITFAPSRAVIFAPLVINYLFRLSGCDIAPYLRLTYLTYRWSVSPSNFLKSRVITQPPPDKSYGLQAPETTAWGGGGAYKGL